MATLARKVSRRLHALFDSVRLGGLIPVSHGGFWTGRSSPSRSLKKAAALFNQLGGDTIIEIGSGLHGSLAGNSIMVWVKHTSATRIVAVDIDPKQIEAVRGRTSAYPNVEAVVDDGIEYLRRFPSAIDLLYLDFWARDPEGAVPGTGRAEMYRDAYRVARDRMSPHSMILIDDTDHVHPWKHTYVVLDARRDGYTVVYTGRQTLLRR